MVLVLHLHGHYHGTGIDLVGLLQIGQLSVFFQLPHGHQGQIHQADEFIFPAREDFRPGVHITLIGGLDGISVVALPKLHLLQFRGKSGVAAMI